MDKERRGGEKRWKRKKKAKTKEETSKERQRAEKERERESERDTHLQRREREVTPEIATENLSWMMCLDCRVTNGPF